MNRPEGYLLSKIEEAFAKQGGLDEMRLLDIVGGAQIGQTDLCASRGEAALV